MHRIDRIRQWILYQFWIIPLCLVGFLGNVTAQSKPAQQPVLGIVVDTLQRPLPGVSVRLLPGGQATATDGDGRFSLLPRAGQSTLSIAISAQGKEDVLLANVQPGKPFTVTLRDVQQALAEVVVTGYGELAQRRSAGSVSIVLPQQLDKGVRNLDEMLQGKVPGLVATAQSGRPGERYRVVIRGTNTINGSTEPLWVVDGVPLQQDVPTLNSELVKSENLNEILNAGVGHVDPADIEQITVLKDASAAAIYGSRAAGGVIVITTKRGKAGQTRVNYSTNLNVGLSPQRDAGLMNSSEKIAWEKELWEEFSADRFAASANHVPVVGIYGMLQADKIGRDGKLWMENGFVPYTAAEKSALLADLSANTTDWFGELFRNSFAQNHHLSFSGGNNRNDYYVSMGYTGQQGMVKHTGYDRYNITAKLNTKVGERLDLGWTINLSRQQSDSYSMSTNPFDYAYYANPYERAYDRAGNFVNDGTYHVQYQVNDGYLGGSVSVDEPPFGYNILREMENTYSDAFNNNAVLAMNLNYRISKSLSFNGLASYTYTGNTSEDVKKGNTFAAFNDRLFFDELLGDREWTPYGSITQSTTNASSYNVRGHFVYQKTFGMDHGLRAWAGAEIRGNDTKRFFTKRYGYNDKTTGSSFPVNLVPDDRDHQKYTALINSLSGQVLSESRFASFYGSADYTFRSRYVLNATLRTDGSNNFGSDEQFNPTWSLGAAWHIEDEPFFAAVKPVVNRLTLRAATGFTGNVVPGVKKRLVLAVGSDWNNLPTGRIATAPNPNLRWEKTYDRKLSLDFGLLDNRISGSVETYFRRGTDVITESAINGTTGFGTQSYNTSEIQNRGLEGTLQLAVVRGRDFRLSVGGNIAWNENKLAAYRYLYGENNNIRFDLPSYGHNQGLYVGYPINGLFGGNYLGIDPYYGVYSFALRPDANLVDVGDLNDPTNYVYYLGTPQADVTGGVSLRAAYRNLSLSLGGNFFHGASILNLMSSPAKYGNLGYRSSTAFERPQSAYSDLYRNHLNVQRAVTNRWTAEQQTGVAYPRIVDYAGERLNLDAYNPFQELIVNSAFREDVSFFRLRDITLGYTLPDRWLTGTRVRSLSVSGTLNNFFTLTNYTGIDPETPGATYPVTRSVFFRLQAGF